MCKEHKVKISQLVCDNYDFLKTLSKTKSLKKRQKLLKKATTPQLLSIAEICLNIVKARFRLTQRQKKRMLPYADFIRRMSRVRSERGAKQIVQKGSGLQTLFPALLTPIILELSKILLESKKNDIK
jgi:hypothetical protein